MFFFFQFKKVNHSLINRNLFLVYNNIPKTYTLNYVSLFKNQVVKKYKNNWNVLFSYTKPKILVKSARINFLQCFFLKRNPTILNNFFDIFSPFSGDSISSFFKKSLSFIKPQKTTLNNFWLVNNVRQVNPWFICLPGDVIKQPFYFLNLLVVYKVSNQFINKINFILNKHLFFKNMLPKLSFSFFFNKNKNNLKQVALPYYILQDKRTNSLILTKKQNIFTDNHSFLN